MNTVIQELVEAERVRLEKALRDLCADYFHDYIDLGGEVPDFKKFEEEKSVIYRRIEALAIS